MWYEKSSSRGREKKKKAHWNIMEYNAETSTCMSPCTCVCREHIHKCLENSVSDRYWTSRSCVVFFPLSVIIPYTFNTRKFILFFFLEVNIPKSILLFSALHRRYTLSQFPLKNLKPTAWLLKEILFCPASVLWTTWKKPPGHSLFWTSLKETDTVWLQLINPQTWGINNIILLSDAINMTFTN